MNCEGCQQPIPEARLQAVPGVKHCVKCQPDVRVKGRVVYDHKTAGAVEVLTPQAFDAARRIDPRMSLPEHRRALEVPRDDDREEPTRRPFSDFSGRIPNNQDCQAIVAEMEDFRGLEPFERAFIDSNLNRHTFSDKQKVVLAKMAKRYELKSWRP